MTCTVFRALALTLVLVVAVTSAQTAHAKPVRSDQYGYEVTVPDDWAQIDDADVRATAAAVQNPNGKNVVVFDTAFQPASHAAPFEYPYVIVQVFPYAKMGLRRQVNEDEFRDVLKSMTGANVMDKVDTELTPEARALVSGAKLGQPTLEKDKRRFWMVNELTVNPIGQIRGLVVGHFGRHSMVQVCFYARAEHFDRLAATGRQIGESLVFDTGQEYSTEAAAANPSKRGFDWSKVGSKALIGAAIGGLVGAFGYAKSRMKKNQGT